ncbi:MAG TPA: fused MFS/spermidine synthase [Acidimicrobiia bacterium]|nr:fused MFS/spermidine synthase [Acidimicrobiia bacterium]
MPQLLARSLVFIASAAVLILEILAGRLLAPYLGVSLEVFTGIIGVILAGISVGAWAGGRAADRGDPSRLIGPLLVAGGLTAVASPLLVDLVGPAASTGPVSIVGLSLIGFFAPAAVLSAIPPIVVKIRLASLTETGAVVGTYSAIGTAGAIFGTFVTGFVLIAAFPTRPIVIVVGVVLVALGVAVWVARSAWTVTAPVVALVVLSGLALVWDGPCQYETSYHCAEVVADTARPSGRLLILDRGHNSYVDLEDPTHLEFRYIRVMADVIDVEMPSGPIDVVSIGGGGFTLPGYLAATRPGTEHRVLEIDASLVDIGRRHLGFEDEAEVIVDDARRSITEIAPGSVDVVVGDAFTGLTVPWHLTTVEFVEMIGDSLTPGGFYTVNVIDRPEARFARAEAATLREVFDHVAVFAPEGYFTGDRGGNYVLVGSDDPIDMDRVLSVLSSRGGVEVGLTGDELARFIDDARPLTDDFAPVDQMLTGL